MTDEEYFIKHYPDVCYNDKPLSPYWDLFEDGTEFGERQSEKQIEELKKELTKKADTNHSLVEQMADLESKNAELKNTICAHEYYQNGYKQGKLEESRNKEVEIFEIQGEVELRDVRIYDLNKKVIELEKENAELKKKLKEKLKTIADRDLSFVAKFDALEKENAELKEWQKDTIKARGNDYMDWSRMKDQLTKAKEIICEYVRLANLEKEDTVAIWQLYHKAEQFIKEIEK